MALQLNSRRHVEVRRGLKGSAWGKGNSVTRTPALKSTHFIQRLGEARLESSTLSAVLHWAELKEKQRVIKCKLAGPPCPAAAAVGSDSDSHHPDQQSNA